MRCRKVQDDVETRGNSLTWDEFGGGPDFCPGGIRHEGGVTLIQASMWNAETSRPDAKGEIQAGGPCEDESTDAGHRGGATRSSDEGPVIGLERRGCVVRLWPEGNRRRRTLTDRAKPYKSGQQWEPDDAKVSRPVLRERGGEIPRATHLFVKVNGKLCYLWRAVDHEGGDPGGCGHGKTGQGCGAEASQADHEEVRRAAEDRHRRALLLFRSDERAGQRRPARGRWPPQQSGGEFAPAVSTTRTSDAAVSKYEDAAEVQLSSRPGPQPFQSGAPSRHPPSVQAETLCRIGGVARPCSVDRRSREGMSRYASTTPRYFDNAIRAHVPSAATNSTSLRTTSALTANTIEAACDRTRNSPDNGETQMPNS